jgi:hypothetical protein
MLRGIRITDRNGFVPVGGDIKDAVIGPGNFSYVFCRQDGKLPVQFFKARLGKFFAETDQGYAAVRIMLGLAQKVAGNNSGIGRVSAITIISVDPPGGRCRQRPKSWRLASATNYFAPAAENIDRSTIPIPKP